MCTINQKLILGTSKLTIGTNNSCVSGMVSTGITHSPPVGDTGAVTQCGLTAVTMYTV